MKKRIRVWTVLFVLSVCLGSVAILFWVSENSGPYRMALAEVFQSQKVKNEIGIVRYTLLIGTSSRFLVGFDENGKQYEMRCEDFNFLSFGENGLKLSKVVLRKDTRDGDDFSILGLYDWVESSSYCFLKRR